MDLQPSPINNGILCMITGKLQMDENIGTNNNVWNFTQVFQILPNGKGGYYCKLKLIPTS